MEPITLVDFRALSRCQPGQAMRAWAAGHPISFTRPDCAYAVASVTAADFSDGRFARLGALTGQVRNGRPISISAVLRAGLRLAPGWSGTARTQAKLIDDIGAALALAGLVQAAGARATGGQLSTGAEGSILVAFQDVATRP